MEITSKSHYVNARILGVFGLISIAVLLIDYFEPAVLQVDMNAPRIRLVRHRKMFPDQEYILEWQPRESLDDDDDPILFGQKTDRGFYAWEIQQVRGFTEHFENYFEDLRDPAWLRTNFIVYERNTLDLPTATKRTKHLPSAAAWAREH